ncbi:MAG: prepilin-type N-terminal cleavage/methylation domain-containing protein [Opitutaceae bacterium]|nr:prepilin-type N-terminal cleavage/methylation domain-containing protein [Opitutaceae bacterium]
MNSPTTHDPCRRLLGTQGFTLVEIMIVVVIIGLLAAMAVPAFQRIRRNVQNKTFANDLRQIRGAAEQYIMEQSAYPEDGTPGAFPAGLAEYLPSPLRASARQSVDCGTGITSSSAARPASPSINPWPTPRRCRSSTH